MEDRTDIEFLEPGEASRAIGVSVQTLLAWRQKGIGPSFITLPSGSARYRRTEFEKWLAGRTTLGDIETAGEEVTA